MPTIGAKSGRVYDDSDDDEQQQATASNSKQQQATSSNIKQHQAKIDKPVVIINKSKPAPIEDLKIVHSEISAQKVYDEHDYGKFEGGNKKTRQRRMKTKRRSNKRRRGKSIKRR